MSENTYRHIGSFLKEKDKEALKKGKNHLFAIAIDDYEHCPKLYNAVKDAKELIAVLTEKYEFEKGNIITLFNKDATEEKIDKAFLKLTETVTSDDNLVIFFSGHGEYDKARERGHWVPVDAEQGAYHNYISNTEIRDNLDAISSKHTFLIADSCFSGSLFATYKSTGAPERLEKDPSRWGLTAGRTELVLDGKPGNNSPFADSLIYQLRNATKPVGVSDLCNKVIEAVISNADQTPRGEPLKVKGHQGGQFFFHPRQDEADIWAIAQEQNTVESYGRYVELFPKGKYLSEANQKIRALKEDEIWALTEKEHTAAAYKNYLREYKSGKYYAQAVGKLAEVEEEEYWQEINLKNTYSAFLEYKVKYPKGKYFTEAESRIKAFEESQEKEETLLKEKKAWADKKAKEEANLESKRGLFKTTVNQAEHFFKQGKYAEAKEAYRESMKYFHSGFTPDMAYLEKKVDQCNQKGEHAQLIEDGKNSYLGDNYTLALQYFNKAAEIEKTKKVSDWIKMCQQKMRPQKQKQTRPRPVRATTTTVKPQPKKKKSRTGWIIGGVVGIIAVVSIIVAVVNQGSEISNVYDPEVLTNDSESRRDENDAYESRDYIMDFIVGNWMVSDVIVNGYSMVASGTPPYENWDFYDDGTAVQRNLDGQFSFYYSVNGNLLTIGQIIYTVHFIDSRDFQLSYTDFQGVVRKVILKRV